MSLVNYDLLIYVYYNKLKFSIMKLKFFTFFYRLMYIKNTSLSLRNGNMWVNQSKWCKSVPSISIPTSSYNTSDTTETSSQFEVVLTSDSIKENTTSENFDACLSSMDCASGFQNEYMDSSIDSSSDQASRHCNIYLLFVLNPSGYTLVFE